MTDDATDEILATVAQDIQQDVIEQLVVNYDDDTPETCK